MNIEPLAINFALILLSSSLIRSFVTFQLARNNSGGRVLGAGSKSAPVSRPEMNQKSQDLPVATILEPKQHAEPVEQRWEESEGKYLHKKFKKMATAVSEVEEEVAKPQQEVEEAPHKPLKHSALSMIRPATTSSSTCSSGMVISSSSPYQPHCNPGHVPKEQNIHVSGEMARDNVLRDSQFPREHSSQAQIFNLVQSHHQSSTQGHQGLQIPQAQQPSPEQDERRRAGLNSQKKRNVCPFCQLVCAKPSVLDKHIRTHTNERPYPCQPCGFAFKTKSNLYKHCKSRTHNLKVEKGIDSSKEEIVAELGDSGHEEVGTDIRLPIIVSQGIAQETANSREVELSSRPPAQPMPIHPHIPRHVYPTNLGQGFEIIPVQKEEQPRDFSRKPQEGPGHRNLSQPMIAQGQPQGMRLPTFPLVRPGINQVLPTDFSNPGSSPKVPQELLQQRIDKVISENQAIVDTFDPLWPKRYMRQNSREKDPLPNQTPVVPATQQVVNHQKPASTSVVLSPSLSISMSRNCTRSPASTSNPQSNMIHVKPLDQLQFRPGYTPLTTSKPSDSPLNLVSRPKITPDPNPLAANSIKELWINSQKKPPSASSRAQLEELANIEAGNTFHPKNPEGSMIKELLLKARMSGIQAPENGQKYPLVIEVVAQEAKSSSSSAAVEDPSRIGQKRSLPLPNKVMVSPPKKPRTLDWNSGHGGLVTSSPAVSDCNPGLLQISKVNHGSGGLIHSSALAGIPAPNLSGSLLTGIKKPNSLFSLPGKLENHPPVAKISGIPGPSHSTASTMNVSSNPTNEANEDQALDSEKFRRPESLPLAPGSFKTKKHVML